MVSIVAIGVSICAVSPATPKAKPSHQSRSTGAARIFGTNAYEAPSLEEYRRMTMGGISSLRLLFYPGFTQPNGPAPNNWRDYDALVAQAARGGISVDPILFGLPSWMSSNPSVLPIQNASQEQLWFNFVRDAARRYGPGGDFWAQHRELTPHPMQNWEVWNEPNIDEFAGGERVTPRQFARLLRITRAALDAANPANRIVIGGLYRRPKPGLGIPMTRFLAGLYRLHHGRGLFDAVAIHPYASKPMQILNVSRRARAVMNRHGDTHSPLWITEIGWTTGGNYWAQSLYRATPQQQATRVGRSARLLLAHRRELRLKRVDWMTWRDYGGGNHFWSAYMGFFTADGHPKPAWSAFTRVTGGVAGGAISVVGNQPVPNPPPPGGSGSKPPPGPLCLLPGILC